MKHLIKPIAASLIMLSLSACSVYMAATQEDAKDMTALNKGAPRALILGKLGQPITTETNKAGNRVDYFSFTDGYKGGTKAARAVTHGVLDIATLGLWEIIGTPIEGVADGDQINAEVTYGENNTVESYKVFANGELVKVVNE